MVVVAEREALHAPDVLKEESKVAIVTFADDNSQAPTELAAGPAMPVIKKRLGPTEIFAEIHREDSECQTLPKRKGNLKV